MRPNGSVIRDPIIRIVIMGATTASSLEVEDFRIGNPRSSLIRVKVSLVGPFKKYFRYQVEVRLVIVYLMGKVVVNHKKVFNHGSRVAILDQ